VLADEPMPFVTGRFVETRHLNPEGAVYEKALCPKLNATADVAVTLAYDMNRGAYV
jgi:hypothetical protein